MAVPAHRKDGANRIVQLTDCHIGPVPEYRLASTCTCDSFRRVLSQLRTLQLDADLVLVTGDIVGKAEPEAYRLFEQEISELAVPWRWLPGNHDDPQIMTALSVPFQRELRVGPWLLLMLNSAVVGEVGGRLVDSELAAISRAIQAHDGPVAAFVHHPPVAVGSAWLDEQSIENGEELLARLSAAGNVRALFTGHVHQTYHTHSQGMDIYTTPSTCFQFKQGSKDFALSNDGPGCRWIDFYDDGTFDTGVIQLDPTPDQLNHQSSGY